MPVVTTANTEPVKMPVKNEKNAVTANTTDIATIIGTTDMTGINPIATTTKPATALGARSRDRCFTYNVQVKPRFRSVKRKPGGFL